MLSVSNNDILHPNKKNESENNKCGKYQDDIESVQMTVRVMIAHQSSYMKEYTVDLHKQETSRKRQILLRESREDAPHATLKRTNTIRNHIVRLNETYDINKISSG